MTLWTEEGDLGSSKMKRRFEDCSIRSNGDFMKQNLELLKGAKHLQSNSDFINKTKERPNTAHPLHENFSTVTCIFYFV